MSRFAFPIMATVLGIVIGAVVGAGLGRSRVRTESPHRAEQPAPAPQPATASTPERAPRIVDADHPGPAGIAWGTPRATAKKIFSKNFTFAWEGEETDGHAWLQRYKGRFAGVAVENIEAAFTLDKAAPSSTGALMAFIVVLPEHDERPASRRWLDLVEKMRDVYGEPTDISDPPEDVGAAFTKRAERSEHFSDSFRIAGRFLSGMRFDQLDREIKAGTWQPNALWRFRNGVSVRVVVIVGDPDRHGSRSLKPAWFFMHDELSKTFFDATANSREF